LRNITVQADDSNLPNLRKDVSMATGEKMKFPVMPTAHWWALRKKFQQTIPGVVTVNYIASVLDMKEHSARANILPALRSTKIIDDEGKTTERARRFRDDGQYPAVCKEIVKDIYPAELREAFDEPAQHRQAVSRWFANHTGGGAAAVYKMVSFYLPLCEADPSKAQESKGEKGKGEPTAARTPRARAVAAKVEAPAAAAKEAPAAPHHPRSHAETPSGPAVHINLQVHISADASTDQIEQVFASMAKHIYKKAAE
jgi:hypothetical protein